ncbi:hypothetical protein SAMN05443669_10641 [Flavobacterium xanthum]|uniref:Uncharacterized protein n=1 Tax=Flavobacterium xanthum TaxID=69322 RepID=A0A1M7L6Y6_9FLAO|nr:hypothetical protein SAMN05443669_10641 [Flavobacterium xanthum]
MENFKINLNQNLWALIVSLLTLGSSEYYNLKTSYYFGIVLSIITSISVIISLYFYTKNYIQNKSV